MFSTLTGYFLQEALNTRLGNGNYTVLVNDRGSQFPHIHVQYNKGVRRTDPGDVKQRTRNPFV